MPRRKPRNLDAVRYELGTFERQLAKDALVVQGIKSASGIISASILGLGMAAAGFFMYNKVDDLKEYLEEGWKDGFGLVNDPAQTQEQVSNAIAPDSGRTLPEFKGMPIHTIYQLHYDERDALMSFFSQQWCAFQDLEWTGPNDEKFKLEVWHLSIFGGRDPTFRFERNQVIQTPTSSNEISEYVYQMIIRETASRNNQARLMSGALGLATYGIGTLASEATHAFLRNTGFMRGDSEWNGKDVTEAPGYNPDPLLNYAWARTDFQTGKWWSTVDSQGDVLFWEARYQGHQGFAIPNASPPTGFEKFTYEQVIHRAFEELEDANYFGPVLRWIAEQVNVQIHVSDPTDPAPALTLAEEEAIRREGEEQQKEGSNESGRDDYMPGEEAPEDSKEEYGPPR